MAIETEVQEVREEKTVVPDERRRNVSKAVQIVWFLIGLVTTILMLRVVLALIGANLNNQFANLIYTATDPFVAPFRGLLKVGEFQAGIARFELETVVAAVIYLLVGWGIVSAIRLAK